jgi:hypothetical protein
MRLLSQKILVCITSVALFGIVWSATDSSAPIQSYKYQKTIGSKVDNAPTAGSKQYSSGNFGHAQLTGQSGQSYYSKQQLQNGHNSVTIGSKQYGRNFQTNVPGGNKLKHNKIHKSKKQVSTLNKPTQGSKVGSNQVFNYPNAHSNASGASSAQK